MQFLSTLSLRRATDFSGTAWVQEFPFLSTLSLRRATRRSVKLFRQNYISIHALLAESDKHTQPAEQVKVLISIHALLAESDSPHSAPDKGRKRFLSTLSLRRATRQIHQKSRSKTFLSTLSLRRATRGAANCYLDNIISIHALLAESDTL